MEKKVGELINKVGVITEKVGVYTISLLLLSQRYPRQHAPLPCESVLTGQSLEALCIGR